MDAAARLGMPKLLACCERRIAIGASQAFSEKEFWNCIPPCSTKHIADGLRKAVESTVVLGEPVQFSCSCCGRIQRGASGTQPYRTQLCACMTNSTKSSNLSECVPSPKDFLEIAEHSRWLYKAWKCGFLPASLDKALCRQKLCSTHLNKQNGSNSHCLEDLIEKSVQPIHCNAA